MLKRVLLAALAALPFTPAQAQHALVVQKLEEWNRAAPAPDPATLVAEIKRIAPGIYGAGEACRASAVTLDGVRPATADRFVFTSVLGGGLRNGWLVTARLPGCDSAPVRFMTTQAGDGTLRTIRVNRGRSHAWDSLIGDTLPLVALGAQAAMKRQGIACEPDASVTLGVTRIAGEDGLGPDVFGARYAGGWREVWPVETCGRKAEVTVAFTADGDGGAYTRVPGDEVRILAP